MKKKPILLAVSIIVICFCILYSSAYYIYYSDGLYYRPTYMIPYQYFAAETFDAIDSACDVWDDSVSSNILLLDSNTHSLTDPSVDSYSCITKGERGLNNYLSCTFIYSIGDYIVEADIDYNVSFSYSNNGNPEDYNVQNVTTHELGHAIGLGNEGYLHEDCTMYTWIYPGETKKCTLEWCDYDSANAIY